MNRLFKTLAFSKLSAGSSLRPIIQSQCSHTSSCFQIPYRSFSQAQSLGSNQRITVRSLCDMIGTRYYLHNEEINYGPNYLLRVYDENDVIIGDMPLHSAQESAKLAGKDLVLRNTRTDPPVAKIMNYKLELMKRLFQKLGTQLSSTEGKYKQVRMTSNISVNDLENKKKKAISDLKGSNGVKFYMKVNIYDEDNIQKGMMILKNLAEDLKQYGKVEVGPVHNKKGAEEGVPSKKPDTLEEVEILSEKQRKKELYEEDDEAVDDKKVYEGDMDPENMEEYVFMQIGSSVSFREIDIDEMLKHTTLDEFFRGLQLRSMGQLSSSDKKEVQSKMVDVAEKDLGEEDQEEQPMGLSGRSMDDMLYQEYFDDSQYKQQAIDNLKRIKQRRMRSEIFSETKDEAEEDDEDFATVDDGVSKGQRIDLTKQQSEQQQSASESLVDEYDLLGQQQDMYDLRTYLKMQKLNQEIDEEVKCIKARKLLKLIKVPGDPLKLL